LPECCLLVGHCRNAARWTPPCSKNRHRNGQGESIIYNCEQIYIFYISSTPNNNIFCPTKGKWYYGDVGNNTCLKSTQMTGGLKAVNSADSTKFAAFFGLAIGLELQAPQNAYLLLRVSSENAAPAVSVQWQGRNGTWRGVPSCVILELRG